jgi:hypothetical protein
LIEKKVNRVELRMTQFIVIGKGRKSVLMMQTREVEVRDKVARLGKEIRKITELYNLEALPEAASRRNPTMSTGVMTGVIRLTDGLRQRLNLTKTAT